MTLLLIVAVVVLIVMIIRTRKKPDQQTHITPQRPTNDYGQLYHPQGVPTAAPPPANAPPAGNIPNQVPPQYSAQVMSSPQSVKPAVPKKPFSPIPLLLIAGVVFLFLGGIIFLTGTWDMLSDTARALSLLSASVIAFGINILAERVLKLPKTGLAFYILGCIFLPLALGGIGAFSLFGEWFSFHGDGASLLMSLIALCVAGTSFLGQSNYKSPILAWLGLTGMGGTWMFLCIFVCCYLLPISDELGVCVLGVLLVLFAAGCTIAAEGCLRQHSGCPTPLSKAWLPFLYLQNAAYLILTIVISETEPAAGSALCLLLGLLFLYERFISGQVHTGVIGFTISIFTALITFCDASYFQYAAAKETVTFVTSGAVFLLLSIAAIPHLKVQTRNTMGIAGMILSIAAVPMAVFSMFGSLEDMGTYALFLFVPLVFAAVQFAFAPKNPLPKDAPHFLLFTVLLYSPAMSLTEDTLLLRFLLIGGALLLLLQSFLSRRLWPLTLSICTCLSVPLMTLDHGTLWVTILCAAALLSGLVYAHLTRRPLLERCCGWAGLPFLLAGCASACSLFLGEVQAWILALAVLALVYLAESTLFRHHIRSAGMRTFCMNLPIFLTFIILIEICTGYAAIGWMVLFALSAAVLTAANLRRNVNIAALPMIIYLFVALREIVLMLETVPSLLHGWILGLQIGCYVLMLLMFAGMGRLLLPDGFCRIEDGIIQVDWGLLAAALPVWSVASTIDWYPSILRCLLLSVYSLLYIGRVKNRYVPAVLASAFGCLTIFFHNINDPFGLLEIWKNADFKAPQILLYLLPMHLFILSMVVILPKKFRSAVHIARFCMYCFTTLCLLGASLLFNRAEDGIILAVFSFLILLGGFAVKRLRWFTLGFSVLFLMTVKLTWEFWQSLHWGIYLFLAGAVLIGMAFYYEYAIRRADEKPQEPKEKIKLFKEWNW